MLGAPGNEVQAQGCPHFAGLKPMCIPACRNAPRGIIVDLGAQKEQAARARAAEQLGDVADEAGRALASHHVC